MRRGSILFTTITLLLSLSSLHMPGGNTAPATASQQSLCPFTFWRLVPTPNPANTLDDRLRGLAAISASDIWAVGTQEPNSAPPSLTLAGHWNGASWAIVSTPNVPTPGVGTGANELLAVSAISTSDVWAVGDYVDLSTSLNNTLIEHWNGTAWSVVASPSVANAQVTILTGVAAIASNDVWAVGYSLTQNIQQSVIEHWNGSSWSLVTPPNTGRAEDALNGIYALASNDIWTVGGVSGNGTPGQTLTEHFDGTAWAVVPSANVSSTLSDALVGVSASSTRDVWAVGSYYTGSQTNSFLPVIEHWNGSSWSLTPTPTISTGGGTLHGAVAISSGDAWAVGQMVSSTGGALPLIEHWNGTAWTLAAGSPLPSNFAFFYAVTALSAGNVWAVGSYSTGNGNTLAEHYPSGGGGPMIQRALSGTSSILCA